MSFRVTCKVTCLYRYIPDSALGRGLTFLFLFLFHGAHSLSKTLSIALLTQVNWLWFVCYMVVDHAAFQLLKLSMGNDFFYWMPRSGPMITVIFRFIGKTVTDFTGFVRTPFFAP